LSPISSKIVSTAHSLTDSLNLLKWIMERSGDAQIVGIAMGEPGIVSRILSLRAGSPSPSPPHRTEPKPHPAR
jgi:3-dehydroquinate dehydratase/shikimate dehydrogenase